MKIFNSLTGQKEEFIPHSKIVSMYVCGVTVYDNCHIGHAMSYIIFDSIKRYLEYKGYEVKHVQNFTDIDDKIINRAKSLNITATELSEKYINEFFKDMDALNIKRATIYPRATQEIDEIIKIISHLIRHGFAYEQNGSVYFRVNQFSEYGKLSHQNIDEMITKTTSDAEDKDSPLDFALWKAVKPGEPSWQSPWAYGRPGWHIECTAMSLKYLGSTIDIHGGGQDLVFPHHENEITQSESYTGLKPFAKYWMHNGLLQFSGTKMSKSLGNLINLKDALNKYSSDALRLFILSSHYRNPLTFSEDSIQSAETGMERLRLAVIKHTDTIDESNILNCDPFRNKFMECMDDDFNTAQAIAVLFDLARDINKSQEEKLNTTAAKQTLLELAGVLGFTLSRKNKPPIDAESLISLLINIRKELRTVKNFQIADSIRNELSDMGIILEDKPEGTTWKQP
jgi:cysteinyl-tRNA synthetase